MLLMEEILHQLIGSLSHYLQGFNGGAGFLPSTLPSCFAKGGVVQIWCWNIQEFPMKGYVTGIQTLPECAWNSESPILSINSQMGEILNKHIIKHKSSKMIQANYHPSSTNLKISEDKPPS